MNTKLSGRWSYALVLSIIVLVMGFVALGVRAFASEATSSWILFAALGIVLLVLPLYFAIRRLRARGGIDRNALWMPRHDWLRRNDRRKSPAIAMERTKVANERRKKQLAGFSRTKSSSIMQND